MTRVSASAKDAVFLVDGQTITGAAVFTWPAGSKHTLEIALWQYPPFQPRTRYTFQQWSVASGPLGSPSNLVVITADAGVPWYNADLEVDYVVSLRFFQCSDAPCASPGTVWVNQVAYQQDADIWMTAGSTVALQASPGPGYVFGGWLQGPGTLPAVYSFQLNASTIVYPSFALARSIQLLTSPSGLQVLADRAPVTAPITLEWGWNTTHSLGVVSPQRDLQGRQWVFQSWSDGGTPNHSYQMAPGSQPATVTAQFVRAVAVGLLTDPPGLTLTIDGLDAVTPQYLAWAPGETHSVSAPLHQNDGSGAPWVFRAWSNVGANAQTIAVVDGQVEAGVRLTAAYDPLSRIRVDSLPSGLALSVDGADCRTPCEVERTVGSTVRLAAPASVPVSDGVRLDFASWDGATAGTLTATAGYRKVVARYGYSYRLTLATQPAGGGTWRLIPAVADGFYPAGGSVSVAIDPASGMKFRGWTGDLTGAANPAALLMDAPHSVLALFDKVPATPAPPHVVNAAGETPVDAVAAGSLASLTGANLADSTAEGAADPLPQSLAGVSLLCSGRLLPLLYVSPQQINFQVPGDFAPGKYQLQLLRGNAPTIEAPFTVARNAPGLLLIAHQDGSPATADAPAARGEHIVLYGTGFGPLQPAMPDGFRIPSAPPFPLVDAVEVLIGDRVITPDSAAAIAGAVGVIGVQLRIPEDLDPATPVKVAVRTGGVASNTLYLPLN